MIRVWSENVTFVRFLQDEKAPYPKLSTSAPNSNSFMNVALSNLYLCITLLLSDKVSSQPLKADFTLGLSTTSAGRCIHFSVLQFWKALPLIEATVNPPMESGMVTCSFKVSAYPVIV